MSDYKVEVGNEGHICFWFSCQLLALITLLALTFTPSDILAAFRDKRMNDSQRRLFRGSYETFLL
uniref:Uncharacterized protein n=1 Tax=Anguilla anguilla TaxID=7936 RepID=A0A0E9WSG6_ANGAN